MNPVDYFAKDTIKRALGARLVPVITKWEKTKSIRSGRDVYRFSIGIRMYVLRKSLDRWSLVVFPSPNTTTGYMDAEQGDVFKTLSQGAAAADKYERVHPQ